MNRNYRPSLAVLNGSTIFGATQVGQIQPTGTPQELLNANPHPTGYPNERKSTYTGSPYEPADSTDQKTKDNVNRESADHLAKMQSIEKAPLAERKAGAADWAETIKNYPKTVGEHARWLLYGHYGFGPGKAAHDAVMNPRVNSHAVIGQTLAALDHGADGQGARDAWNKLSKGEQATLHGHIQGAIDDYKSRVNDAAKGKITNAKAPEAVACPTCEGSGRTKANPFALCAACAGSGEATAKK